MSSKSSKSSSETNPPDSVVVGRVRKPHGLRGEVLVEVLSDVPGRLQPGAEVVVSELSGRRIPAKIATAGKASATVRIRLEGFEDRDKAETLKGALLEVPFDQIPVAPEGAYYYFELIGCACHDETEGDLGTVVEVVEDGGGLLLRVESEDRELLLPFVKSYLKQVSVEDRRIDFLLPAGLVETCGSKS